MSRPKKRHTSAGGSAGEGGRSTRGRPPVPATKVDRVSGAFILVAACFFLSGAAALTLEMVWSRSLRLLFGSTTLAISTVLVAYMLGLGLGGLLGGRIAGRLRSGVRVYGWVEIGIGAYALGVPWLLSLLSRLDGVLLTGFEFWGAALLRFGVVLVVLLLPTMLMGATLPILVSAVARQHAFIAGRVGLLYGINTLGAVTGVLGATFVLFPLLGLAAANLAGALLAATVGCVALGFVARRVEAPVSRGEAATAAERTPVADSDRVPSPRWNPLLLSYGLVGFTALAYEVCWTRALAMVLGSSIYAFATMLAAFLAGIALGSLASRRWWDRLRRPQAMYALGIGVLGSGALLTMLAFGALPRIFVRIVDIVGLAPGALLAANLATAMLAMLAPTLVLGALFPLLLRALSTADQDPSRTVGDVYFMNTVGCALGAFSAGFLLIPGLGLQRSMAVLIALNFAGAAALLLWQRQWIAPGRSVLAAGAAAVAVFVLVVPPRWQPGELNRGVYQLLVDADEWRVTYEPLLGLPPDGILLYREGINTTVAVERREGEIVLRVNGKPDAGSEGDMPTQVLTGQVPLLFGGRAERLMVLGLASGVTVGSLALHHPREIDVVELEPAMVDASRYFDDLNYRPLDRAGTRVIFEDGRIHLARRPPAYDVIVSEPSNPWISGVSNLFTREFFRATRAALAPDGILLQWVQLYGLPIDAWTSILAAMQSEFPHLYVFAHGTAAGDSLVLASSRTLGAADFPRWENLSEEVREDLRRIGSFSTTDLWSLLRLGPEDVAELAAEAPVVNGDDNMFVELSAPYALHDSRALDVVRERMDGFRRGALPHLEAAGIELSDAEVGDLALSYATRRRAVAVAKEILAQRPGLEAHAWALDALLLARRAQSPADAARARQWIDRAVATRPDVPTLRWHRATVLQDLRFYDEALKDIDAFLLAHPDHARARAQRARILFELGRMAEARAAAAPLMASRYIEYDADLLPIAAVAAARLGDLDGAIADVRRYLARAPNDDYSWRLLADLLDEIGEPAAARDARENIGRAQRNGARQLYLNALRMRRLGERDLAETMLRTVLERMPEFEPARQALR